MTNSVNLQVFRPQLPLGNLDAYIGEINRIPLLTREEEQELATRLFHQGDLQAAQRLILSHLRYVARVAKMYRGYGLPLGDLIQEGTVGLMKAVKRFNPDVGVRLVSFAVHWIKAEIHEYIIKNWRIVKVATTKSQRKLFFNLRSARKRLGWFTSEEVEAVARDLGVKAEEVRHMEARLNAHDLAFDLPAHAQDAEFVTAPAEYLAAMNANPEQIWEQENSAAWQTQKLKQGWGYLDSRSQDILQRRWLNEDDKATLQELALHYGISQERIRQLETNALKKLKEYMTE